MAPYLKKTVKQAIWLKEQNFMFSRQFIYDHEYNDVISYSCEEIVTSFMHHLFGEDNALIKQEFNNSTIKAQEEIDWLYTRYKKAEKLTQTVCDELFEDEPPHDIYTYVTCLESILEKVIQYNQSLLSKLDNTPIFYLQKLYLLTGVAENGQKIEGEFIGNTITQMWANQAQEHEFYMIPEPPEEYQGSRLEWIFQNNCLKIMEGSSLEFELQLDENSTTLKELMISELPQEDQPENLLHHAWLVTTQELYEQFYDAYMYQLVISMWLEELFK